MPLRPELTLLPAAITPSELSEAAAEGCAALALAHDFAEQDISHEQSAARQILLSVSSAAEPGKRDAADLWSALFTDGAVKDDRKVKATPLCAMFGQGHQHFLDRLSAVPKGELPKELAKLRIPPDLNAPSKIEEALFKAWKREDRTESFRWDPLEDRRYALRFADPSTDKGLTVHGANRLASIALPMLTVAPVALGWQQYYPICLGSLRISGEWRFRWPCWRRPASFVAIRAMLAIGSGPSEYPPALGVDQVYEATRISVGKFFNFTRGQPVT